MVTKSSHRIAEGERSTNVIAVWMHGHETKNNANGGKTEVDKNPEVHGFQKCGAKKHKESRSAYDGVPHKCEDTVEQNPDTTP